ncbi:MAG: DUF1592 domain-containing protein [Akkermansiaceae bacterium]|nr:DUF1592 domain-containing protein [Akkermansiaceae bacterium]
MFRLLLFLALLLAASTASRAGRAHRGLLVLYDFSSPQGPVVKDRAGTRPPLDLRIANPGAVRRTAGTLQLHGNAVIRSDRPAAKVIAAVRRSGELTVEAWIQPANTTLDGPARIVTLSANSAERNFTLGQDGHKFDVRLRTTRTSTNGIPSLASPPRSLKAQLVHVIYTRGRDGMARLYLDGSPQSERKVAGDLRNWDASLRLAIGNELTGDRPWKGTCHLVAIYGRALTLQEVRGNHRAGPRASGATAASPGDAGARFFETKIAPLLARNCLECHDAATRKGDLDLSRRDRALAGGKNGKALVPGDPDASLLWEEVSHDDMPKDRDPLKPEEKALLQKWITDGARWSLEAIDPAIYAHAGPAGTWVQRLTVAEYIATVQQTMGVDISAEARRLLPPDLRADGFSNTAYNLNVDLKHVEAYARLAAAIVDRLDVPRFAGRFSKNRKLTQKEIRALIAGMGRWILRGPLEAREIDSYHGITTTVASGGGGFEEAVRYVIEAMLQSPRFLYRLEHQQGDGEMWPAGDYELASRLSYIIWGCSPDETLMKAAAEGLLTDPERLEHEAKRLLAAPRAVERSLQFVHEWLDLGRLDNLRPDRTRFPRWDPALAADMQRETRAFFEEIVWKQKRPLSELLNAPVTFATPRLAAHYGLAPRGAPGELARHDLNPRGGRGGLLTQGSVLTIGGDDASMVTRGLFVMHDLLRGVVKDPPPGVDTTPIPSSPGVTQRFAAERRINDKACGGCHARFEPLAFALEKYDGLGAFRHKDEFGNALREDGEILLPGAERAVAYGSARELVNLLAASDRVKSSLTWKLTQFALGRPLGAADAPHLEAIHREAQKNGGTYQATLTAIVLSDLVRLTRTEPAPP